MRDRERYAFNRRKVERLFDLPFERRPVRFNHLARMLGGASKKTIVQCLKELEAEGMLIRKVISDRPIAVSYKLTNFGRSALKILDDLRIWSETHHIELRK